VTRSVASQQPDRARVRRWKYSVSAGRCGQQNLSSYSLDELSRDPAVASKDLVTRGKSNPNVARQQGIYFLEQGRSIPSTFYAGPRAVATTAFWTLFRNRKDGSVPRSLDLHSRYFFDAEIQRLNWKTAQRVRTARCRADRPTNAPHHWMMIGELNASHSGIARP